MQAKPNNKLNPNHPTYFFAMKFSTYIQSRSLVAGLTLLVASPAWAVIPFTFTTNGSSVITGGTWTGDGTVQPNIVMGSSSAPVTATVQYPVTDFTSGTLGLNSIGGSAPNNVYITNRILSNPLTATHSINLTGGNADLRMHNSNSNDGGALLFNSIGLTNFDGVTSVSWTTTYNQPIAGRDNQNTNIITRPMGMGLALIDAGLAGTDTVASYRVDMTFNQIFQETTPGVFVTGVPGAAAPFQSANFLASLPGATSFTSQTFDALDRFLLVRGYDVDGGGYDSPDADEVYMRQMTWTIRRDDGGAFDPTTIFVFSMDGQQYSNYTGVPIPEPSSMLLIAGSLIGGCLYRRRKA